MKQRKYRFEISTVSAKITDIIILAATPEDARADAITVLNLEFGRNFRIKTDSAKAKVMRRLPKNIGDIKRAFFTDTEGNKVQFAWYVYAD